MESCCDVWFHVSNYKIVLSSLRKRTKHDWAVEIKNHDVSLRSTLHVSFFSELSVQSFFYFYEQRILQFTEASLIILHICIYTYLVIVLWRFSYTSENYKSDQGYENHLILKKTMVSTSQQYLNACMLFCTRWKYHNYVTMAICTPCAFDAPF